MHSILKWTSMQVLERSGQENKKFNLKTWIFLKNFAIFNGKNSYTHRNLTNHTNFTQFLILCDKNSMKGTVQRDSLASFFLYGKICVTYVTEQELWFFSIDSSDFHHKYCWSIYIKKILIKILIRRKCIASFLSHFLQIKWNWCIII